MIANNVFRLAMILSSGQAQNFQTNLRKLIKLVLFDRFGSPINLLQIQRLIQSQYSLTFSEEELLNAMKKDDGILVNIGEDDSNRTYELTPTEFKKIQMNQTVNLDNYIIEFLSSDGEKDWKLEEVKDLIYRFLYFSFNTDTKTVLELMNKNIPNIKTSPVGDEFSPEEAKIINAFLNWDYTPKNEFVLNLISSCYDYCMLTVKKDTTSYSDIFNGKEFYLDSNIVFRLAGFNNIERQVSIDSFIKKCTDAGIKICYTNHTYAEIKSTIKFYVDAVRILIGDQPPISMEAMRSLSSKYDKLDFYQLYIEWCKIPENKVGDFEGFRQCLELKISRLLQPFKFIAFDNFDNISNHKTFDELCEDFKEYKYKHYRATNDSAIKVDVNNYLYMMSKASENDASDFMQLKYYFISADHCLTEWATNKRPGVVPTFVLPSVWYSILLKYKGRTNEDYLAFCQFLNIRIAPERDESFQQKRIMLSHILGLNEEKEIKEKIIFDIKERLCDSEATIEDPYAFVEESHQTILKTQINEALAKANAEHAKNVESIESKAKDEYDEKLECAEKEKFSEGQEDIIQKQADGIVLKNKRIIGAFWSFIGISVLVLLVTIVMGLVVKENQVTNTVIKWVDNNSGAICIISGLWTVLLYAVKAILSLTKIITIDNDEVIKKLRKKYNKN